MSGLPTVVPPQSMPIGTDAKGDPIYLSINWYLFIYNLSVEVLGTGGGGTTPTSPSDQIDADDLLAVESEIPQAYRQISNVQLLMQDPEIGPTLRDMANAFVLGTDWLPQDPAPAAQPAQTIIFGASGSTWTAPFNGCLSVTGGTVSAIAILRQSATVATGITVGLIPVSRNDQIRITYSAIPTVVFLPT